MVTAPRDKRSDHGLLVALCAREHRRFLAAVIVAPLPQADERDMKVPALCGQVVLVPLRPFLIGNPLEDSFRMVPSVLSEDLHRRIKGSELIIYPDSGHGGIFQFHDKFAPAAIEFLDR
jgi:pimeloyl-ACP methyl ester carboxylesterase